MIPISPSKLNVILSPLVLLMGTTPVLAESTSPKSGEIGLEQPWRPGIEGGPEKGVDPEQALRQDSTIGAQGQDANMQDPGAEAIGQDAPFDRKDAFINDARANVEWWDGRIQALDPDTLDKDLMRRLADDVKGAVSQLEAAGEDEWEESRETLQTAISRLSEEYAELPQARKSSGQRVLDAGSVPGTPANGSAPGTSGPDAQRSSDKAEDAPSGRMQ